MRIRLAVLAWGSLTGLMLAQTPPVAALSGEWTLTLTPSTKDAPVGVGGRIIEPRKVRDAQPVYPPDAQVAKVGGTVVVAAIVDHAGNVADLRVTRSIALLDRSALNAVSQWGYSPSSVDGQPVEVLMTVNVGYSLDGGSPRPPPTTNADFDPSGLRIKQDRGTIEMTRVFPTYSETVRYRLDGRSSLNQLPKYGSAVDGSYTYSSRWNVDRLITSVTWRGVRGPRQLTETIILNGETLTIQAVHDLMNVKGDAFTHTAVYNRKR
jgi:TonB family protein